MGSSSSSTCSSNTDERNLEGYERFNFRFTDCSCKCDASKKRLIDHEQSQTVLLNVLMKQNNRAEYDISKRMMKEGRGGK